jgi:hypothetical protein
MFFLVLFFSVKSIHSNSNDVSRFCNESWLITNAGCANWMECIRLYVIRISKIRYFYFVFAIVIGSHFMPSFMCTVNAEILKEKEPTLPEQNCLFICEGV